MTYNTDIQTTSDSELTVDVSVSSNLVDMIETIISSLEQDDSAMVRHLDDDGHLWTFKYGSVDVFVQLTGTSEEDMLTVWSTVLALPVKDEAGLMRKLLQMNWSSTFEACFAILNDDKGDQVVVSAARTVAELSPGEISRNVTIVATIADEQNDALSAEFSAA